jgi:hypothetical protein
MQTLTVASWVILEELFTLSKIPFYFEMIAFWEEKQQDR